MMSNSWIDQSKAPIKIGRRDAIQLNILQHLSQALGGLMAVALDSPVAWDHAEVLARMMAELTWNSTEMAATIAKHPFIASIKDAKRQLIGLSYAEAAPILLKLAHRWSDRYPLPVVEIDYGRP